MSITIKALVRRRDGQRCTNCGMTRDEHIARFGQGLQVHRIRPGSPYSLDGCVTLCRPCHRLEHPCWSSYVLPRPINRISVTVKIDASTLKALRMKSLELGLSVASVCRVVVEMFAAGELPAKAVQTKVKHRRAAKSGNKSTDQH